MHGLKYLKSTLLGCKDIGIRKLEFVAKTQFVRGINCIRSTLRWVHWTDWNDTKWL